VIVRRGEMPQLGRAGAKRAFGTGDRGEFAQSGDPFRGRD